MVASFFGTQCIMDVLATDFRRGRVHWNVRSITLQTAIYTVYTL